MKNKTPKKEILRKGKGCSERINHMKGREK